MQTLPSSVPEAPTEEISGLTCPDCFGALGVSAEGSQQILRFRCRIGHLYSAEEVIVGKEKVIEEHLWAAVTALNELRALLRDLVTRKAAVDIASYDGRAERAAEQEKDVRRTIERNTPTAVELGAATDGEQE
jgi:two-component system chemotaxis response regulator CheB